MVEAGLAHRGVARMLVHHLKYRGILSCARLLAGSMASRIPAEASVLVPVRRATIRRLRYGIDPAVEFSWALSRATGMGVLDVIKPGVWWPRHASRASEERRAPLFRVGGVVPVGAVLVDDVVRTGSTLDAAAGVLKAAGVAALAATAPADRMLRSA